LLYALNIGDKDCIFSKGKDTFLAHLDTGKQTSLRSGMNQNIRMVKITADDRLPCSLEAVANNRVKLEKCDDD